MNHINTLSRQVIKQALILDLFILLVYGASLAITGHRPIFPEVAVIIAVLVGHWLHLYAMKHFCIEPAAVLADRFEKALDQWDNAEPSFDSDLGFEEALNDPWSYQRKLMEVSDQPLPSVPTLNKGGMLYGALILEETGETMAGLAVAMQKFFDELPVRSPRLSGSQNFWDVMEAFKALGGYLQSEAKSIRSDLQGIEMEDYPLSAEVAVELLDGTTDIAVVNCGFALACGLPGSAAYAEVGLSNLSKINPTTGVIDKTADGKWIKGSSFFKPDLVKILHQYAPLSAEAHDAFFAESTTPPAPQ